MTRRPLHLWRFGAGLTALAASVAACGGGGDAGIAQRTVPADRWTTTLCGSLKRYDDATKRSFLTFQGLHLQFTYGEPKQGDVRDKQLAASEAIVGATDRLIADIDAAGAPDTRHGRDFASGLDAAFRELRDAIDHIHTEAAALPSGSGAASGDAELSPQVGAALADLQHRIKADQLHSGAGLTLDCGGA